MFILSFLEQIQLCLIADDDLMTAVQCPDAGRVHFVRITEIDAMKVSAEEETDRIHRTVRHPAVQLMLAAMISDASRHIRPETYGIGTQHGGRMYGI